MNMAVKKEQVSRRTVYYVPVRNKHEQERELFSLKNVLDHRGFKLLSLFYEKEVVGIKPCFNNEDTSCRYVFEIAKALRQNGVTSFVCNTSNRYKNIVTNGVKHTLEALSQEYWPKDFPVPYVMLDGIKADYEISNKTYPALPKNVFLAGELPSLNGLVSVCLPRPSELAGLSGAIVNLGMGLASKKGKIRQNTMSVPKVNVSKCYKCRKCLNACPVGAIYMNNKHVEIDEDKCINCGLCTEIARFGGITYDWNATPDYFQDAVVNHAHGAVQVLKEKVAYVSPLLESEKDNHEKKGVLISRDPVAIDSAVIDIYEELGLIDEKGLSLARKLITRAENLHLGRADYKLDVLAY